MNTTDQTIAASRAASFVPALLVLVFSVAVGWISFTVEDPEPYLFPRLLSGAMILLSVLNRSRALRNPTDDGIDGQTLLRLIPGVLVLAVLTIWAAGALGFYVSGLLAMFLIYCLYDPNQHTLASITRRLLVSLANTALYWFRSSRPAWTTPLRSIMKMFSTLAPLETSSFMQAIAAAPAPRQTNSSCG